MEYLKNQDILFNTISRDNDDDDDDEPKQKPPLPTPAVDAMMEKKFLDDRQVFLWGVVDDKSARAVVNRLLYLNSKDAEAPITLYINSPGGVVTSGMIIYDTMQMINAPVHTVCMGLAASMGSIILSAGTKGHRSIFPSGEVMIHQPSIGGTMRGTSADLEIQAEQIRKTKAQGAKILADNCGKKIEDVLRDFERDYWMDATEAKAYGIIDTIVEKL
jgi:ATP-dependent Clp protease, protease subunit